MARSRRLLLAGLGAALACTASCRSARDHRVEADRAATTIIDAKQLETLGSREPFTVERPRDTLRRRLLEAQGLPISGVASRSTQDLPRPPHWPQDDYLDREGDPEPAPPWTTGEPLRLTLVDALQIGARGSREYQSRKEDVFTTALAYELELDLFRNTFAGRFALGASTDPSGSEPVSGVDGSATASGKRLLRNGASLAADIGIDLAQLLTQDRSRSLGVFGDASITIPLLRGSAAWVVQEPLTQAGRDVVYALRGFVQYRRQFAVSVAEIYLSALQVFDQADNAAENYRRLIQATRRARRLADAGRLPELQVDQATQDELRARDRWISANEARDRRLDELKRAIGLPPDARIALDRDELGRLNAAAQPLLDTGSPPQAAASPVPPADAPVTLTPPTGEGAGPLELDETRALHLAFAHRPDLVTAHARVADAQRAVTVAADALRAEATLLGSAAFGARRTLANAGLSDDARLRLDRGRYSGLLTIDLPIERTREQITYRSSYIALERAVRDAQALEDQVKSDVRNDLRDLRENRASILIQAASVAVARRRVASTDLFLQAGRAEIRDVLEAQEALVSAQNALTTGILSYRLAELHLQRDTGLLTVDPEGLWHEYRPPAPTAGDAP